MEGIPRAMKRAFRRILGVGAALAIPGAHGAAAGDDPRLADIRMPDGSMLASDDKAGRVYRIACAPGRG